MTWRSLQHVLGSLENQPAWQQRQQFQRVRHYWLEAVGPVVSAQTRPVAIQNQTLKVATSSAMWAQTLTFERQRILEKLNARTGAQLTDIRFSTAQWYEAPSLSARAEAEQILQNHPSRSPLTGKPTASAKMPPTTPSGAFQQWADRVRSRAQSLPLCPACQCPTPVGELQRWATCSLCAAKSWTPAAQNSSKDVAATRDPQDV